jgi:hypothetical protein
MQYRVVWHRDGQRRGGFISQAVRKNVTLGDKVLGHVAGAVLLPYYTVQYQARSTCCSLAAIRVL